MSSSTPSSTDFHKWLWLIIAVIVVALAACGLWYFATPKSFLTSKQTNSLPATNTSSTTTTVSATIKNDTGLETASKDLDSTNINSIDTTLSQNDTDAAAF